PSPARFPYTTLFRPGIGLVAGLLQALHHHHRVAADAGAGHGMLAVAQHLGRGAGTPQGETEWLEQLLQHGRYCVGGESRRLRVGMEPLMACRTCNGGILASRWGNRECERPSMERGAEAPPDRKSTRLN